MKITAETKINGSKEEIWKIITDFENSVDNIKAIEKIEVLEKPDKGLVGFKWRETRTMFGKTATEVMWITDVKENEFYKTRAENHGAIYYSSLHIKEDGDQCILRMDFDSEAQSFGAKIMAGIFGVFFKGATRKAIAADLNDIKEIVEA